MKNDLPTHELEALRKQALNRLTTTRTSDETDVWRVDYLGRKGKLTEILRSLASVPVEQRRLIGSSANQLKVELEEKLKIQILQINRSADQLDSTEIDISLPGRATNIGHFHPLTITVREICSIFQGMGFQILEGPEVEWDLYNFERLNIPKHHPARDQFSTLWVNSTRDEDGEFNMLLRAHTSPMQARIMERSHPPIRVVVPGKVWRYEATDATHESQFTQVEGLVVDKGITFANLRHTLFEFARQMFGIDRNVRFRCDYFPFVEPGVDMSVDCFACMGKEINCTVCRGTGWIEILGAGMVHPNVLKAANYDPEIYTGFAFGLGQERIAMLKHGIDDIRLFHSNDIRFLRQF